MGSSGGGANGTEDPPWLLPLLLPCEVAPWLDAPDAGPEVDATDPEDVAWDVAGDEEDCALPEVPAPEDGTPDEAVALVAPDAGRLELPVEDPPLEDAPPEEDGRDVPAAPDEDERAPLPADAEEAGFPLEPEELLASSGGLEQAAPATATHTTKQRDTRFICMRAGNQCAGATSKYLGHALEHRHVLMHRAEGCVTDWVAGDP